MDVQHKKISTPIMADFSLLKAALTFPFLPNTKRKSQLLPNIMAGELMKIFTTTMDSGAIPSS